MDGFFHKLYYRAQAAATANRKPKQRTYRLIDRVQGVNT